VQLGDIQVKDISELHQDMVIETRRYRRRLWFRKLPLNELLNIDLLPDYHALADQSISRINPLAAAMQWHGSIYVSFTVGVEWHEDYVFRATVYELAHCLWDKLREQSSGRRQPDWNVPGYTMASEGYATYAESIWFVEAYPAWLKNRLAGIHRDESAVAVKGMRAIQDLVAKYGPAILLRIPTEWETLFVYGKNISLS
jgi:hypothetical protein